MPSNRHVIATASAISTLASLAGPERVTVAVGTGLTARITLGQKPLKWAYVADYVRTLRTLLRGDTAEWDGARIRMLQSDAFSIPWPIEVEILIGAAGPKGRQVAQELGDGVIGTEPMPEFARNAVLTWGTVLEETEPRDSERVLAAAGPAAATFAGHYPIQFGGPEAESDRGRRWREAYADVPPEELHLEVHTGHLAFANRRDRPLVTGELLGEMGLALSPADWHRKLHDLATQGTTEIVYQPAGPDIPRELEAFANVFQAYQIGRSHSEQTRPSAV